MNKEKLQKQKKMQETSLFILFMCFIVFLFYLAYQFIHNQLKFEVFYILFPLTLIGAALGSYVHLKEIERKLKS